MELDEDDEDREGILEDTEVCLREILKLDSDNVKALVLFGEFWLDRGDNLEEGLEYLQRADQLSPTNKQILFLIKECQQSIDDEKTSS